MPPLAWIYCIFYLHAVRHHNELVDKWMHISYANSLALSLYRSICVWLWRLERICSWLRKPTCTNWNSDSNWWLVCSSRSLTITLLQANELFEFQCRIFRYDIYQWHWILRLLQTCLLNVCTLYTFQMSKITFGIQVTWTEIHWHATECSRCKTQLEFNYSQRYSILINIDLGPKIDFNWCEASDTHSISIIIIVRCDLISEQHSHRAFSPSLFLFLCVCNWT